MQQLTLFIDPQEIVDNTKNKIWGSVDYIETDRGWKSKFDTAVNTGFLAEIEVYGVQTPVTLILEDDEITMGDGHHRVAVAAYLGIALIPVLWLDWLEGCHGSWSTQRSYPRIYDDKEWNHDDE